MKSYVYKTDRENEFNFSIIRLIMEIMLILRTIAVVRNVEQTSDIHLKHCSTCF